MEFIQAVKIGNLVTEMHNVLNTFYNNDKKRKKAIRDLVEKIYKEGYHEGYCNAGRDEQGY